ncbi:MAG: hypothetical protein A3G33_02280 [Omnitrophica bacterium RIFCSPLOWO2_12_FULL_44_17]|uniref:Ketoreductase domain-containing protein n=1 Tax=Candidatus Danuiimicrobium aquiferis TaxID=1801832 RepID=A0A1G1L252_9BACT|nr:MAG: hypothetical protein A3B72_08795 [Omnitrophica bacterium RIFCSPHIGHO2_02_FULL_45_28]OGW91382.1 MAG: hypothetical protein A3E74_08840 [Omnitrophica bacterium RIFCSPHIGHO2_12_FULL_44_12]OGW99242.1 MAG: hypothetical protein A3G33_02280 [Omnitrophica bacterium RIFCSPLOWO2_12_FULL_44_17]OGX03196.1 MAG: hypothetical protein A3J12_02565 [Omnitrophica bacterium RIFCSPLOWO2_02_FULL_44_11]
MDKQQSSKRWVLITGASRGIGEAFARRFAKEGWNLILVARTLSDLETLVRDLKNQDSIQTKVIVADLSDRKGPQQVYDEIKRAGITLDGLVNNAGCGVSGNFLEASLDRYLSMVDVNVYALLELTHRFLPEMIRAKKGLMINVSSTASFQPLPGASVYSATKAFVTFLTEAIWLETRGSGVRVINLCPGWTKTDFAKTSGGRDIRKMPLAETTDQVIESAFRAIHGKMPTVISGVHNRVVSVLVRFLPRRCLFWLVGLARKIKS